MKVFIVRKLYLIYFGTTNVYNSDKHIAKCQLAKPSPEYFRPYTDLSRDLLYAFNLGKRLLDHK